jgi:signal transduction histidine kinase
VRTALDRTDSLNPADLVPLFALHYKVVPVEPQLLESSERRMEATERRIESESRDLASTSRLLLGACLVVALLCAILTVVFARRSIRKIQFQTSELSRVSWRMLQSQEMMARRFSHELHNELGQSLVAVKSNLSSGNSNDWPSRKADCIELVDQAIANVRELSQLLHPVILDDFGLDAGLCWLTDGFSQRTGTQADYVFRCRIASATSRRRPSPMWLATPAPPPCRSNRTSAPASCI